MPSRKPSNIVYLSGGTVPQFREDYDVQDPGAERQYYDQLAAFRRAWCCGRSLSIGDSFDVAFPGVVKPEGGRKLPSPSWKSEAHLSVVCTADVRTRVSNEIRGTLVLKIFQLEPFSLALSPKQLAGCENYAYDELKGLQGTVIPYYYGKHMLAMKNGEVARVLVFEPIYGISLEVWIDSYPEHSDADESRMTFLTLCCMDHYEDLVEWAQLKGFLGCDLVYPGVSI
ncbi:hypothetical protein EV421DRAFT_1924781 [Armillaria borealis]|uniref:Uncharacterized protein n=1 Tax=Armillaria borealis TaxID=47425 RepID=A0AA39IX18_9AGAR|nr:hypothetical protein EV421DRAFT_1924781 [Armillaria borealis]